MIKPMSDEEVIIHLQDMANVNYKATDILIKRVKQFNKLKEMINNDGIAIHSLRDKLKEIVNEEWKYKVWWFGKTYMQGM